jgi:3-hydroxyacyl-CoA dehydrogenase
MMVNDIVRYAVEGQIAVITVDFENSPKPVIAAIHGTVLGGGLEVALVAHYRVAVPSAKAGLPEVNIGLLPGAGGTQRLPRIVGVEKALEMVTSGQHVPAKAALAMGLFDSSWSRKAHLRAGAIAFARRVLAEDRPLNKVRELNDKVEAARGKPEIFADFRKANAKKFRGFMAPENNIKCIEAAVNLPFDEGLKEERAVHGADDRQPVGRPALCVLRRTPGRQDPGRAGRHPHHPGQEGRRHRRRHHGRRHLDELPQRRHPGDDHRDEAGEPGPRRRRHPQELREHRQEGPMTQDDVEKRMGLLTPSMNLEDLADCDLIIEAVFELMEIKKEVFGKLDKIAKPGAILASNTSYLDIDVIAASTSRPGKRDRPALLLAGQCHEAAGDRPRCEKTDKSVIATSMQIGKKIGKVAVLVGNCHGFVGNRMLAQRQREAQKLILEGAMPWDVDRVLYDFGLPMGPFAMSDLAGLDIGWDSTKSSSSTVREVLCEMDRRGQKNGKGFYDYDENRNAKPSPIVEQVIRDFAEKRQIQRREISDQEILERCLYPMVNEGAKILEEGKAIRASDIDIVWINGYGWPVYRGGPMFWGELVGWTRCWPR